jgi:hypothetical protein
LDAAEKALRRQRYRTRRVRGDGSTLIGQGVSAVTLWGGLGGLALTGAIARRRRTPAVA